MFNTASSEFASIFSASLNCASALAESWFSPYSCPSSRCVSRSFGSSRAMRLVLRQRQLQHVVRLRPLHIAQRPQIDLPQQLVRRQIVRVPRNLILRRRHRLANPPHLEVQIRQPVLQQRRVRVRIQRQLVLLHRLRRVVRPARVHRQVFIQMRQPVVVVGGRMIRRLRRSRGRGGRRLLLGMVLQALRHQHLAGHAQQGERQNAAAGGDYGVTQMQSHCFVPEPTDCKYQDTLLLLDGTRHPLDAVPPRRALEARCLAAIIAFFAPAAQPAPPSQALTRGGSAALR